MITAKRFYAKHLTSSTKLCCLFVLHRIQGSKKTSKRNRCQGAADIQIHLRHLLATSQEITSKSSLGESTPIYLVKCFYSRLYFTQLIKRCIIIKTHKDFVLIYIFA